MALKTRPRSRRAISYRPRRPTRRRGRVAPAGPTRGQRPATLWIGIGGFILIVALMPWLGPILLDAFAAIAQSFLGWFGLGLAIVFTAIVADVLLAWRRPLPFTAPFWRVALGLHLLGVTAFGILGFIRPGWGVGDVSFADVSAGGDFGRLFAGSVVGILVWLVASFAGISLVWPRGVRLAGVGLLAGVRRLVALDLPGKAWEAGAALLSSLLPEAEGEEGEGQESPETYVPTLDEDWTPMGGALAEPTLEEGQAPAEAVESPQEEGEESIMVTSPPAERPAAYQRPLPMGRPASHGWELPPLDLLMEVAEEDVRQLDNQARAQLIVDTLRSFGVDARVIQINQGPTVTQFGIEPGWETKTRTVMERDAQGRPIYDKDGNPRYKTEVVSRTRVRVNRITSLANDLALALAAPSIRIEAPVPGKPVVGIEVPNTAASLVTLRSVIESSAFQRVAARSRLALALGKGVSGEPAAADLTKMPHLLIAGATGSGKSVCINSIIGCLLLHNTPADLRLILIDPKRVELSNFAKVPHLAFSHIVTDLDDVVGTLGAVLREMESRYRRFASIGVRNIEAYNRSPRAPQKMPYWVVIIDELADLMISAPYEVERQICRLAQLARATGIHLIIATQRPSVDVVTGLIKANFPTRIAFAVSSQVDSRTIIDGAGAEKLLGRGDMLFMPTDASKPRRLQGSYVSDQELERIVAWWTDDRFRHLRPDPMDHLLQEVRAEEREAAAEEDPLYEAAKELALEHTRISTSLLQRRLHIGYPRAARLIDLLEQAGIIGPPEGGGQSRRVLLSPQELDQTE